MIRTRRSWFGSPSWFGGKLLTGAALAAAILLEPTAASSGQMSANLQVALTVTSGSASLSVAPSFGDATGSANAVSVNSAGSVPYALSIDQGLNATGNRRNLRGDAGTVAYKLCRDIACDTVWATDDDPANGIVIAPASAMSALPLTVLAPKGAKDASYTDVVTLTMYF
jgi:spore coat protein U-like protein